MARDDTRAHYLEVVRRDPGVYLAIVDGDFIHYRCGPAMAVVYDGTRFRRF
jgi:hypothetical protein